MRFVKFLISGALAILTVAGAASSASAQAYRYYHYGYYHRGPVVYGPAGAVVTGVVSLAAVPVVLAANLLSAPFWIAADDSYVYYGYAPYYGPGYYYPPPRYWHRYHSTFQDCCYYGY